MKTTGGLLLGCLGNQGTVSLRTVFGNRYVSNDTWLLRPYVHRSCIKCFHNCRQFLKVAQPGGDDIADPEDKQGLGREVAWPGAHACQVPEKDLALAWQTPLFYGAALSLFCAHKITEFIHFLFPRFVFGEPGRGDRSWSVERPTPAALGTSATPAAHGAHPCWGWAADTQVLGVGRCRTGSASEGLS